MILLDRQSSLSTGGISVDESDRSVFDIVVVDSGIEQGLGSLLIQLISIKSVTLATCGTNSHCSLFEIPV